MSIFFVFKESTTASDGDEWCIFEKQKNTSSYLYLKCFGSANYWSNIQSSKMCLVIALDLIRKFTWFSIAWILICDCNTQCHLLLRGWITRAYPNWNQNHCETHLALNRVILTMIQGLEITNCDSQSINQDCNHFKIYHWKYNGQFSTPSVCIEVWISDTPKTTTICSLWECYTNFVECAMFEHKNKTPVNSILFWSERKFIIIIITYVRDTIKHSAISNATKKKIYSIESLFLSAHYERKCKNR